MRRSLPGAEPNAAGHASAQVDAGRSRQSMMSAWSCNKPSLPTGRRPRHVGESEAPFTVTAPVPYAGSGSLRNPFPPIADYAFLSDCENTCLISSAGSVEWLCVPRPDSPSVFGAILDRGAGHFRLGPYGVSVPGRAAVSARQPDPGDHLADPHRLGDRARRAGDGAVARHRGPVAHASPHADGLGRRAHPAAHGAMCERHGRVGDELRAGFRLPPHPRYVGVLGPGLRRVDRPCQP